VRATKPIKQQEFVNENTRSLSVQFVLDSTNVSPISIATSLFLKHYKAKRESALFLQMEFHVHRRVLVHCVVFNNVFVVVKRIKVLSAQYHLSFQIVAIISMI
jgi:hypothetical protein